jgi:hypothetical protein
MKSKLVFLVLILLFGIGFSVFKAKKSVKKETSKIVESLPPIQEVGPSQSPKEEVVPVVDSVASQIKPEIKVIAEDLHNDSDLDHLPAEERDKVQMMRKETLSKLNQRIENYNKKMKETFNESEKKFQLEKEKNLNESERVRKLNAEKNGPKAPELPALNDPDPVALEKQSKAEILRIDESEGQKGR